MLNLNIDNKERIKRQIVFQMMYDFDYLVLIGVIFTLIFSLQ